MIYTGDYLDNKIYGTAVNKKIKVTTEDEANFLLCQVSVSYNGLEWTHPFEAPFFSDAAELYFENYIHSIIIQNLKEFTVSKDAISLTSFDIASVQVVLKEMKESDLLEELELNFYMSLGTFEALDYTELENGSRLILPTNNSNFITKNGIVSFSFFTAETPGKVFLKSYTNTLEFIVDESEANLLLHTVFIPIKLSNALNNKYFTVSLGFGDDILKLAEFTINTIGADHATIIYQNDYGTLSALEFTGEISTPEEFKISNDTNSNNGTSTTKTNNIENNSLKYLDTGHILDESKYRMLLELIRSYNIFYLSDKLEKLTLTGDTKITPYVTKRPFSNEILTFKVSENAYIHYRGF